MMMNIVMVVMMMMKRLLPKFTKSCRNLDSLGLNCGVAARDNKLGLNINTIEQRVLKRESHLTDFEKKDIEKRFALMSKKVEEMARSQDVHGLARVLFGSSLKQRMKHFYVLFHGGQQLFLTVTGKGRKLGMEAEWLAKVEVVEAMGAEGGDQRWMEELAATRGLQPLHWSRHLNWPLGNCTEESFKR